MTRGRGRAVLELQDDLCKALEEQKDHRAWWDITLIPYSSHIRDIISSAKDAVHARRAFVTPRCMYVQFSLSND